MRSRLVPWPSRPLPRPSLHVQTHRLGNKLQRLAAHPEELKAVETLVDLVLARLAARDQFDPTRRTGS